MRDSTVQELYMKTGITLDGNTLTIDLAEPRSLIVHGVNSKTGEEKDYLIRVTQFGKLALH
jgi:hypothetical protein